MRRHFGRAASTSFTPPMLKPRRILAKSLCSEEFGGRARRAGRDVPSICSSGRENRLTLSPDEGILLTHIINVSSEQLVNRFLNFFRQFSALGRAPRRGISATS